MKGLNKVFKYMIKIGLVHRDIKPDNILIKYVDSSKTKYIPKIADFGLSRTLKDGLATSEVGTPQYWAPEISSQQYYDNKCDLFSIGVMLYRCYFNSSPFKSNLSDRPIYSDKKLKDCEDKILDDLINRLLIIAPERRISWEEYFNHPFFKLNSLTEINFGFKSRYLKYYKAQYKEDEKNFKTVLVKEMKQNNLGQDFY